LSIDFFKEFVVSKPIMNTSSLKGISFWNLFVWFII